MYRCHYYSFGNGKTYLVLPSRHLRRATSTTNYMFLLATLFDYTQLFHVLLQLHMHKLCVGKAHQFHKLMCLYLHMYSMQLIDATVARYCYCMCVWCMCSREL